MKNIREKGEMTAFFREKQKKSPKYLHDSKKRRNFALAIKNNTLGCKK